MALLHAADAGTASATSANRTQARIWREIADLSGGSLKLLRQKLTWMPAHSTANAIEDRTKSNGKSLTVSEWRANQLADRLAKRGAPESVLRKDAVELISIAGAALAYHAAQLGVITRAANCHEKVEVAADGTATTIKCRDSSSLSSTAKAQRRNREGIQKKPTPTKHDAQLDRLIQRLVQQPSVSAEPTLSEERQARKRKQAALARADTVDATARLVAEAASSATPTAVSAATRMQALRQRLSNKWSSAAGDAPASPNGVSCSLASCSAQVTSDDKIATPSNYEAPVWMDSEACAQLDSLATVECKVLFKGPLFTAGCNNVAAIGGVQKAFQLPDGASGGGTAPAAGLVVVLGGSVASENSSSPWAPRAGSRAFLPLS
jgi:hypothetical protein